MYKSLFRITVLIVVVLALTACDEPKPVCLENCVIFESQKVDSTYKVNDTLQDSRATMVFGEFEWSNQSFTYDGVATIYDKNQGYMEGNDKSPYLWMDNINILMALDCVDEGLHFQYAHWGGNLNISINGEKRNIPNFPVIDGQKIGGATVTVTVNHAHSIDHEEGIVTLEGKIDEFSVGGQELAIDNICPIE